MKNDTFVTRLKRRTVYSLACCLIPTVLIEAAVVVGIQKYGSERAVILMIIGVMTMALFVTAAWLVGAAMEMQLEKEKRERHERLEKL